MDSLPLVTAVGARLAIPQATVLLHGRKLAYLPLPRNTVHFSLLIAAEWRGGTEKKNYVYVVVAGKANPVVFSCNPENA